MNIISKPILFIFSGLPASGKTTLAKLLAKRYNATYLRIDTIEQAIRYLCHFDVQGEGYRLSYRVASDNLQIGNNVVADSCNPITLTRREWEKVAIDNKCRFINIEVVCSNIEEHKKRATKRLADIKDFVLPTWNEIQGQQYDPWIEKRIKIDTANKTIEDSINELYDKIDSSNSI